MMLFEKLCLKFSPEKLSEKVEVSEEFKEAVEFLNLKCTTNQIISFSRLASIATFISLMLISLVFYAMKWNWSYLILFALISPFVVLELISEYPKTKAKIEILKTLGEAPKTLIYLIIPLKRNPNLEQAAKFAAEHGEGRIAKDIRDALWRTWTGKAASLKEELPKLGLKWGKYSPEFKRAIYLIRSSLSEKSEAARIESLNKALEISLKGVTDKTSSYVSSLFIPTLILFSFGTVLPLMFISMLPIIAFFGFNFASPLSISLILFLTVLLVYLYSNKILSKKPPSFSQPKVPELKGLPKKGQMKLFKKMIPSWMFVISIIIFLGFPGIIFLITQNQLITIPKENIFYFLAGNINTMTLIWAITIALSFYAYFSSISKKKLRDKIKQIDDEILDGIYHLANRISENRPLEEALNFASDSMPNSEVGNLFSKTAKLIRRRNVDLSQAFFNERFGTMKNIYSKTVRSIIVLLVNSLKKGIKSSSEVMFTVVNYFTELKQTEKKLNEMIKKSISMMKATVVIFAPIVGGLVITLYEIIQNSIISAQSQLNNLGYQNTFISKTLLQSSFISVETLQLIVGIYILIINIILIRYISIIEEGPDEIEMKLNLTKMIPASMFIFTLVLIASRKLLGG